MPKFPATIAVAAALFALGAPESRAAPAPPGAPDERWWLAYDDPQLRELIAQGLSSAPRMAVASARARRAAAIARGTQAAHWPTALAQAGFAQADIGDGRLGDLLTSGDGRADLAGAGVVMGYEVDLRGRVRAGTAAARAEARAAQADAAATALIVSTGIARAYGHLAELHDLRDLLQRGLGVQQELAAAADRRFDAGAAPSADVQLARSAVAQASAELAAADAAVVRAGIELAVWVGAEPDAIIRLHRPHVPVAAAPPAVAAAVDGPALVAARARTDAAQHRVEAARAAYFPRLQLLALGAVQSAGANVLGAGLGAISAALQLPLLDGGRRRAALMAARAERDLADAAQAGTQQRQAADAASAAVSQRALVVQLERERAALAESTAAWVAQRRRHDAGDVDSSTVLTTEERMLAARRRVLALEARRFALEIDAVVAAGGGWREAGSP